MSDLYGYLGHFGKRSVLKAGHNTTKWIQKAITRPGAFTAKAQAADMGVQEYADKVTAPGSKASTRTKRQANLAKTLRKLSRGR